MIGFIVLLVSAAKDEDSQVADLVFAPSPVAEAEVARPSFAGKWRHRELRELRREIAPASTAGSGEARLNRLELAAAFVSRDRGKIPVETDA
jgi:hypothetical protein